MSRRDCDPCFTPGEKLYRTISLEMVNKADNSVKGTKLRLQVSVARGSLCDPAGAKHPEAPDRINGVAEITVEAARSVKTDLLHAVCVDEPTPEFAPHALIAVATDALPGQLAPEEVERWRATLGQAFRVVPGRAPTKVR